MVNFQIEEILNQIDRIMASKKVIELNQGEEKPNHSIMQQTKKAEDQMASMILIDQTQNWTVP